MMKKNNYGILTNNHNRGMLIRRKSDVLLVFAVLIAMFAFASFSSEVFLKPRNLKGLFGANIGLLILSYAQIFIIALGGVDLSVGSVVSVVNVTIITILGKNPDAWPLAFAVALAIGAGVGLINGLLVVKGNMQPIIATLATQTSFAGVALLIMDIPGGTMPSYLSKLIAKGWDYIFPAIYVIIITAVVWIIFNRTRFGRSILAIGGNEQAAECTGIRVARTKILAFVTSGIISAIAAICITAYTTSGNPLVGEPFTQRSLTTAVVGGALMAGGKVSVIGCIAATFIMGLINNMLNLLNISAYYQYVLQGVILVGALAISALRSKK